MSNFDAILLGLVAVCALGLLIQSFALLAAVLVMRKAVQSAHDHIEELRSSVVPAANQAREVLTRVAPDLEKAVVEVAALSHDLRTQTAEIRSAMVEISERARNQASRLDSIISGVLNNFERAGDFMSDAVSKPVRQFSGLVASVRAIVESLRESEFGRPRPGVRYPDGTETGERAATDKDISA